MKNKKDTDPKLLLRKAKDMPVDREFLVSLRKSLVLRMKASPSVDVQAFSFTRSYILPAFVPVLAAFVFILIIGGTSFASQNSLPGDPLYPVKILSERVSVATALSPQARNKVMLLNALKRVNEASLLVRGDNAEPNSNVAQQSASMRSAINNFNAQISASMKTENDLKGKNNNSGALKIENDIQDATDSFNNIISNTEEKSGGNQEENANQSVQPDGGSNKQTGSESGNDNAKKRNSQNKSSGKSSADDSVNKDGNATGNQDENGKNNNAKSMENDDAKTSPTPLPAPETSLSTPSLPSPIINAAPTDENNASENTRDIENITEQKNSDSGKDASSSGAGSNDIKDSRNDSNNAKTSDTKNDKSH